MYIKEVTVKGYKSYANKTVIVFQPGLNVVVGCNGSGKSNLLTALQMILADEESRKRSRQSMIAAQPIAANAFRGEPGYVEVIFDNLDNFFPEDTAEVSLKRCIGVKDKFFINGKQVERFDKYLAQVGLVTPYAFVQQGRINQLATMNDKNRFELMRVVCGETGWNSILGQIMKVRHDSQILFVEITDIVKRLSSLKPMLKEQVIQLEQYTVERVNKNAAEHVYYFRELSKIQTVLAKLTEEKNVVIGKLSQLKHKMEEYDGKIDKMNLRSSRVKREEKRIKAEVELNQAKVHKLTSEIGKLENLCKDYESSQSAQLNGTGTDSQRAKINSLQDKLEKVVTSYEKYEKMVNNLTQQSSREEIKITQLSELMTEMKGSGFSTDNQRKRYVEAKLKRLQELQAMSEKSVTEAQASIATLEKTIEDKKKEVDGLSAEKQERIQSVEKIMAKISEIEIEKHNQEAEKQVNLQGLAAVEESIFSGTEQLDHLHLKMNRPFGAGVMGGYLGMKRVLDSLKRQEDFESPAAFGYFGTVLENLTCDEGFETAVHVAAGSKLFHHIVATSAVGLKLLREYNRLQCRYEVKFIALNRLLQQDFNYPDDSHTSPLMKHLEFNENVRPAMEFVFGKVLHCVTSEVASRYAKNCKLTCVTFDGDKVSSSGVMSGGYRDSSFNIIGLEKERRELTQKINSFKQEQVVLKEIVEKGSATILGLAKSLVKCENQKAFVNAEIQKILNVKNARREELKNLERSQDAEQLKLDRLKKAVVAAMDNIKYFKQLTDSGTTPNVSTAAAQFNQLSAEMKMKLVNLKDCRGKLESIRKRRAILEKQLEEAKMAETSSESFIADGSAIPSMKNLLREQTEQKIKLVTGSVSTLQDEIRQYLQLLDQIKNETNMMSQKSEKFQEASNVLKEEIAVTEGKLNKLQETAFEEQNKYTKMSEFLHKIGPYPAGAPDYSKESTSRLFKIVKHANKNLSSIECINHRAKEQYEDVVMLVKKSKENGKYFGAVEERITQLLGQIETNKSAICIDTVRTVQESFRKIFQELVLKASGIRGYGRFVMHGDSIEFTETNRLEDGERWWENKEFEGASLKVSFKDWGEEPMQLIDILQLSGGQKSIVALSFLLAVQHANPQCLYVFDEVDQALDPSYREAVAQKMKELSNKAQFLCTTFRKEFVEYADSFLGVSYRNQKSQVHPVTREEALDFVQPDNSDLSSPGLDETILTSSGEPEQGGSGAEASHA